MCPGENKNQLYLSQPTYYSNQKLIEQMAKTRLTQRSLRLSIDAQQKLSRGELHFILYSVDHYLTEFLNLRDGNIQVWMEQFYENKAIADSSFKVWKENELIRKDWKELFSRNKSLSLYRIEKIDSGSIIVTITVGALSAATVVLLRDMLPGYRKGRAPAEFEKLGMLLSNFVGIGLHFINNSLEIHLAELEERSENKVKARLEIDPDPRDEGELEDV